MPQYVDTHCHVHFSEYDADRAEMLAQMQQEGVWAIAVGTDAETNRQVVDLAAQHPHIFASIGIHPNTHEDFTFGQGESLTNLDMSKVVAVGECGLDYFRQDASNTEEKERQKRLFIRQIEYAIEQQLPLMLHLRSSEGSTDAHDDAWEMLQSYKQQYGDKLHAHCHFFTMDTEIAKKYLEIDATFGIPGVVTYKSAEYLRDAVRFLPLEKLLSETDAPYAAPVPHRGKRNESLFVIDTVHAIAETRGEDSQKVREALVQNALQTFRIAI